ncbi:MAG TPA: hypothetical protein VNM34_05785, partial [Verrucomicrobiae bacterium]|nr:hypothetical protein [Verrucomicrobiae bacterium]
FERIIDPPPLEVNTLRLLTEFHQGSLTLADTWRRMFAPGNADTVLVLAREAGKLVDTARARLGIGGDGSSGSASTVEMADALGAFHFPDDLWARLIYDLVVRARSADPPIETLVAALVPVYFGRVGSFVIENRNQTTEQAEDRVERQAREFELLKPYLVDLWKESSTRAGATSTSDGAADATTATAAATSEPEPQPEPETERPAPAPAETRS